MGRINLSGCWKKPTYQPTYERLDGTEVILGFEEEAGDESLEAFQQETENLTDSIEAQAAVIAIIDTQVDDVTKKDVGVNEPEYNVQVDEVTWDESDETRSLLAEKKFEEYVAKKWKLDNQNKEIQQVSLSKEHHLQVSNEGVFQAIKDFFKWLGEKISSWWNKLWDKNSSSDKNTENDARSAKKKIKEVMEAENEKFLVKIQYGEKLTSNEQKTLAILKFCGYKRNELGKDLLENLTEFNENLTRFNTKSVPQISALLEKTLSSLNKDFSGEITNESNFDELNNRLFDNTRLIAEGIENIPASNSDRLWEELMVSMGVENQKRKDPTKNNIGIHSPTGMVSFSFDIPSDLTTVPKDEPFFVNDVKYDHYDQGELIKNYIELDKGETLDEIKEIEKNFSEGSKFESLLKDIENTADIMTKSHAEMTKKVIEPLHKLVDELTETCTDAHLNSDRGLNEQTVGKFSRQIAKLVSFITSFTSFLYAHKENSRKLLIGVTNFIQKKDSSNGGIDPDAEYTKAQSAESFKLRQQRFS